MGISWIFVFVMLGSSSATAFSVGFESEQVCSAYAKGYMARPETVVERVRVAECVGLHTGQVVNFNPPVPITSADHYQLQDLPSNKIKACKDADGCYVLTHDELIGGLRAANNAGSRSQTGLQKK